MILSFAFFTVHKLLVALLNFRRCLVNEKGGELKVEKSTKQASILCTERN